MDNSKKYKWALGGLIVMILLNAAILATLWINKPDIRPWKNNEDHDRNSAQHFMKERLDLTEAQSDTVESLRRRHYSEIRAYRDSLNKYRQSYMELIMKDGDGNDAKKDSLLRLITGQYQQIENALFFHITEMKEILNPEQQKKFQELLNRTIFRDENRNENREHRKNHNGR